jgi:hypothetical protein
VAPFQQVSDLPDSFPLSAVQAQVHTHSRGSDQWHQAHTQVEPEWKEMESKVVNNKAKVYFD